MAAELGELKGHDRTANLNRVALFWAHDPAGRPPARRSRPIRRPSTGRRSNNLLWEAELNQKLFEYRLDANPPRAARAYALTSIACYDAAVACWDAKYAYWAPRPIHVDPTVTPLLHDAAPPELSVWALVGGWRRPRRCSATCFPRDAAEFFKLNAEEMASSRMWAGIHFRSDNETGLALGRSVAHVVIEKAMADGSM